MNKKLDARDAQRARREAPTDALAEDIDATSGPADGATDKELFKEVIEASAETTDATDVEDGEYEYEAQNDPAVEAEDPAPDATQDASLEVEDSGVYEYEAAGNEPGQEDETEVDVPSDGVEPEDVEPVLATPISDTEYAEDEEVGIVEDENGVQHVGYLPAESALPTAPEVTLEEAPVDVTPVDTAPVDVTPEDDDSAPAG